MSDNTMIRVRILKKSMIGRDKVGKVGEIVEVDLRAAIDLCGFGCGEPLDPVAYQEACRLLNEQNMRTEKAGHVAPATTPWALRRVG
jgi:hypothetical protein